MVAVEPMFRWVCTFGIVAMGVTLSATARGQSPDGLKAPEGKLTVLPLLPDPVSAPTTSAIKPASAALTTSMTEPFRDKQIQVAAFIGTDTVLTDDEVWQMVRQRGDQFNDLIGGEREAKEKAIYREELRKLIERELIITELFARMRKNNAGSKIDDIMDSSREVAVRRLGEYRKGKNVTEEEFTKILRSQGLTYKGLRRQLERDALVSMYLEQSLKDKVKFITLNDLWDYYLANPKEFALEERVKWLDLFVSNQRFRTPEEAKKFADGMWTMAMAGDDFVPLVKKYGQGDSNLRNGEGIGTKRGEILPAEMEPMILDMEAGQVSSLMQTATGYHLVKVVERNKGGTRPFDAKVQTEIRNKLSRQVQEREYAKLVDELWRKYRPRAIEP